MPPSRRDGWPRPTPALDVGSCLPAGLLPVSAGYLSDALGLSEGTTVFAAAVLVCAALGGVFIARVATD
ncbi:hypothetical protein [Nocardia otitidiscaviarum]|uniref:hypothetical protein n=1 Tax=Nocardia otitidiscaviarum TaxID=1823 RepID=UPI0018930197|nr:hypothetical protein [Nocardia otitidiscaviarum]MBF6241664.1 hypothetical protein [Nocardia otitidiscaviarum]